MLETILAGLVAKIGQQGVIELAKYLKEQAQIQAIKDGEKAKIFIEAAHEVERALQWLLDHRDDPDAAWLRIDGPPGAHIESFVPTARSDR